MPHKDPETRKNYMKIYNKNRREKQTIYDRTPARKKVKKEYNQSPNGRKSNTKTDWRRYGLIDSDNDNYEKQYQAYLQATNCDVCKNEFKDSFDRCMDHCHDTGLFRQFLCRSCNNRDSWEKFNT